MLEQKSSPDNAFNFLRLAAAFAVLYSHSYALYGLPLPTPVPGQSYGSLAVYVFFFISGYLICSSWERDPDFRRFWIKRALRILPGLFAAVFFTTFIVGMSMTTHSITSYIFNHETWLYFISNITLIVGRFGLPGVFETNPFANAVNASLWTLRYEVLMYFFLSLTGLFFKNKNLRPACWILLFIFIAAYTLRTTPNIFFKNDKAQLFLNKFHEITFNSIELKFDTNSVLLFGIFYFSGCVFFLQKIKINTLKILTASTLLALVFIKNNEHVIHLLWITIPCCTLFMAKKLPLLMKKSFNNDYSYGTYIYAFPIQQIVSFYFLKENIPWICSLAISAITTYFLAILSWHLIEKPSLQLKNRILSSKSITQ